MIRASFAAGFACAIAFGAMSPASAGILDFLFGWKDRTDIARPRHPTVTVSYPKMKAQKPQVRRVAKAKPRPAPAPPVPALTPQEQLARTIDPVKNPRWYLDDPTLKKGDVLVLNDRVVVFTGGALGRPKSYVALSRTRLLTAKERTRVAKMTGREAAPVLAAETRPVRLVRRLRSADVSRSAGPRG